MAERGLALTSSPGCAGAGGEVGGGFGPGGKLEVEAAAKQDGGDDAAAFEDEFGFGVKKEGSDLEHP